VVVAPSSHEPRLAGTVLLDQMDRIVEEYGKETLARAKEKLPKETQRAIDELTPLSWIDVGVAMHLKDAVAREVGKDPIDFQRWVVRAAVGKTIHRFWRALLARVWDSAIVKRAPIIYSKTFDRGHLKVTAYTDHSAEMVVVGWSEMPDYDAIGLAAGIEAVLEYSDRKHARVRFDRAETGVTFHLTWRKP
jgi:hypothetical protein